MPVHITQGHRINEKKPLDGKHTIKQKKHAN